MAIHLSQKSSSIFIILGLSNNLIPLIYTYALNALPT